jgi:hypothetical protein
MLGVFEQHGINFGNLPPDSDVGLGCQLRGLQAAWWVLDCSWVRMMQDCHFEHELLYYLLPKKWSSLKVCWNTKAFWLNVMPFRSYVFWGYNSLFLIKKKHCSCTARMSCGSCRCHCESPLFSASNHLGMG